MKEVGDDPKQPETASDYNKLIFLSKFTEDVLLELLRRPLATETPSHQGHIPEATRASPADPHYCLPSSHWVSRLGIFFTNCSSSREFVSAMMSLLHDSSLSP